MWLSISGLIVAVSVISLAVFGFNYGLDFTGGSLLEVKFANNRPQPAQVVDALKKIEINDSVVQPVGEDRMTIRLKEVNEGQRGKILASLETLAGGKGEQKADSKESDPKAEKIQLVEQLRFDTIGPSVGQDLKVRAVYAIFFVLIAIVVYIAWSFRNVSKPVASWKYGIAALVALFHDVFIVIGIFAILGKYFGVQINTPFVAAILTVLGYSVNDTIVVFDRIRENLPKSDLDFEGTVNTSLNQTLIRSINTSLTVMLVLVSIVLFGGASIRDFALALAIGIFVGTYSSIFVASPVLVLWERWGKK